MKITHLTSAHPRYDTRIFIKECVSLAKVEEYDVSLIVADGLGDEEKDGVKIIDVGKLQGRLNRMMKTTKNVLAKAVELDSDIYHFHDPELIPVGVTLKKMGKKIIYDIHEITSQQIMHREWIPLPFRTIISKIFKKYEAKACRKFDYLLVPQPLMLKMYSSYAKTEAICNFVSSKYFKKVPVKTSKSSMGIIAMHAGRLTESRGLYNMLNAFSNIENAKLLLAGSISKDDLKCIEKEGNIEYEGILSVEEVNTLYDRSDIGIILYNNVGQYYLSYSIKLFEYMLKGMPVIMPDFGEWIAFNERYQCGINVDVTNSKDVQRAILKLSKDRGLFNKLAHNGFVAAEQNFTWESQEEKLFQIYQELSQC